MVLQGPMSCSEQILLQNVKLLFDIKHRILYVYFTGMLCSIEKSLSSFYATHIHTPHILSPKNFKPANVLILLHFIGILSKDL